MRLYIAHTEVWIISIEIVYSSYRGLDNINEIVYSPYRGLDNINEIVYSSYRGLDNINRDCI